MESKGRCFYCNAKFSGRAILNHLKSFIEKINGKTNGVKMVARNDMPEFKCHECDDEIFLPVVNSPRTGICGHIG